MEYPDLGYPEEEEWRLRARCRGSHPSLFFSEEGDNEDAHSPQAEILCLSCSVVSECLEWALRHEFYGYIGGTTASQRRKIRKTAKIICRPIHYIDLLSPRKWEPEDDDSDRRESERDGW